MLLNKKSSFVALGGIATALSFVCLLAASVLPTWKLILISIPSVIVGLMMLVGGNKLAVIHYAAVAVMSLMFLPNKSVAVMYVVALGNYPIFKRYIQGIFSSVFRCATKFLVFNLYIIICYAVLRFLFGIENWFAGLGHALFLWVLGLIYFLIYDKLYMSLVYRTYDLINKI